MPGVLEIQLSFIRKHCKAEDFAI